MSERVSVVIPTFEREPYYLDRAVKSLLNQTYSNVEIIIVDDNKSDSPFRKKTSEYMFNNKKENIVYCQNVHNLGGALSRNRGIEVATGDFITFLDDDDEYLPEKIEKQVAFMKKYDYDMTFTNLTLVNTEGRIVDYREHDYVKDFSQTNLLKTHIMRKLTGTPTFMYKADKLKKIGMFDDVPIGQEFHLMLKTIENGLKIGHIPSSYVKAYRHDQGGISFGETKIKGEKEQYKFIQHHYFHLFNSREKMFIRFRYHLVFAMAYKRNKQYIEAFSNVIIAFVSSPLDAVLESYNFYRRLFNKRKKHNRKRLDVL